MAILLVLIILMLVSILIGKFNWKSGSYPFIAAAIVALFQVLFVVYEMLTMKLPWNK